MYKIHLLPAGFGDSILIEYGQDDCPKFILIDGSVYYNFSVLMEAIKKVAPQLKRLELLVVTHIDIDHIDGIILMLNHDRLPFEIKEIWFNGQKQLARLPNDLLGADQGDYLSLGIEKWNIPQNQTHFEGNPIMIHPDGSLISFQLDGGMNIKLLSPDLDTLTELRANWKKQSTYLSDPELYRRKLDEDTRYKFPKDLLGEDDLKALQNAKEEADDSLKNRSSIAFIATYEGKSCLFAADTPTHHLVKAVKSILSESGQEKLCVDAWKLAHHGSKKSTLSELMKLIDTKKVLVSSDGKKYKHPNPETIAKLIKYLKNEPTFYFNYRTAFNERWGEAQALGTPPFSAKYGTDDRGVSITLT